MGRADSATAFRMDSPAGNKDEGVRESSLTRAYEALGAEVHCLDGADEVDSNICAANTLSRAPSAGSHGNSRSSRRTTAVGLGHAPFAAALDPHVGLCGEPFSAMSLDLGSNL